LVALLERLGIERGRILVIDDDPRMGNLLTRLLQTHGQEYEIIRAGNGDEGLAILRQQRPDLVLMDISMPKMDGYTLLRYIRVEPHLSDLPIAMITANIGTIEDERQLGGRTMMISNLSGLSNNEVLTYLRHTLEAAIPLALPHGGQAVQRGQEVGLDNGLTQVSGSAQ
ncbi:MAG: response regulator, partial [Anaerolineae bacterium]|nr:response regulator [Anaerolineae bacterium]